MFVSWMAVSRTLVGCTKPACRYMIAELVLCGRVMPLSWVLTSPTSYRDETNGCYVTRSSESILGGSPVVPSPCGCPERSRPAVSCPPCSYRACIGMGRINGSVRGFEVRSNGLCVQSHVAPRDVCSTVHGSPRRNNLLVRMVSYRYRCGLGTWTCSGIGDPTSVL